MSADQLTAYVSNGGFTPQACAALLLSTVLVLLLLWGVWAMRAAYVGWAEHQISPRQFIGVMVRFIAMYLALGFLLLS
jgi:integrating conjugative element protein (TIGR03758 family)